MLKVLDDDDRVRDRCTLRQHFQSICYSFSGKKGGETLFAGCTSVTMQVLFQLLNSGIGLETLAGAKAGRLCPPVACLPSATGCLQHRELTWHQQKST